MLKYALIMLTGTFIANGDTPYKIEHYQENADDDGYTLKDTDNLEEKYPVVYPTTIDTELGKQMKAAILNDFENYNSGYGAWDKWTDEFYAENASLNYKGDDVSLDEYKDIVKDEIGNTSRVRINNILVSEDWAAIHFWTVTTNEDGTKEADNHMQFLHFVQNGDKVQVDNCFMK